MSYFNFSDLPFSIEMSEFWKDKGYIVIEDFYKEDQCNQLIHRSQYLIENNVFNNSLNSVFDTVSQSHKDDIYFLESGDKIRYFLEEKANISEKNIKTNKQFIFNKIGHALHDLDEVFYKFSHRKDLDMIAKSIGFQKPLLLQSMYIFKQPKFGGEVVCHQDSTFLYTKPETVIGFWVALEDANIDNGCLWVASGAHKGPLRKLFTKKNNKMTMVTLNETPFEKTDTVLEVKQGTLVLLHGRLPHYSCENKSNKSRHAYSLHIIDGNSVYPKENWLQRPLMPLKGFI